MTVTGETTVKYLYDAANRLTNVVQGTLTSSLFYDDAGRRTNLTLPNGIKVVYRYDTASRLTNISYLAAVTNQIAYTYDQTGSRVAQASLPVGFSVYNLPSSITNSTYNAANQQFAFGSYSILYDADGNVTNIINGTVTNKLVWSPRNQLSNMTGAVTANFLYDGLGRRITRSVGSTAEKYLYDGLDIIQQLTSSGAVGANYFRGLGIDEPWQRSDIGAATTNRIYMADALGSIEALADTNKVIQTQYAYDPFGVTTNTGTSNKNTYKFTAREDDATGLYYYRARYYSPPTGRFNQQDTFAGNQEDPQSLHKYVAFNNDPVNRVDPSGREGELVELEAVQAIGETLETAPAPALLNAQVQAYRAVTYIMLNLDTWAAYATIAGAGLEGAGYLLDAAHSLINNTDAIPPGNFPRGRFIEDKAGANLRGNFPVIDDFREGTATSWKSHYAASPEGLLQWIRRDLDKLDNGIKNAPGGQLKGYTYAGQPAIIDTSTIQTKVLGVAIPESQIKWLTAEFEASIRMLEQEREAVVEVVPVGKWK